MAKSRFLSKFLETKNFGLVIGLLVIGILLLLIEFTAIPERLELKMLDVHFNLKNVIRTRNVQEGVTVTERNPNISQDILIVGIDFKSLSDFGKWPFPRYRHSNLLDALYRIQNENERERAVFLDLFFIEPDEKAYDDALLVNSIKKNSRVFLETVLEITPPPETSREEMYSRHDVLFENYGEIRNIKGNWEAVEGYYGLQPPLKPFGANVKGYGHANFVQDFDKVYRRQALVAKHSVLIDSLRHDTLTTSTNVDQDNFERLAWEDKNGREHRISLPLTNADLIKLQSDLEANAPLKAIDTDNDGEPDDSFYSIKHYQDHFIPSITLALALEYMNKSLDDIEVNFGSHIYIPGPQKYDVETQTWGPYMVAREPAEYDTEGNVTKSALMERLDEIRIPIDKEGNLLVNFMGIPSSASGHQTYPVRPYSGYAARVPGPIPSTWPRTKALGNKILMVGPFAKGMAADEKPTPFGLMYGVEIHANALNSILMDRYLRYAPTWINMLILFGLVMLTALLTSRTSTIWALIISLVLTFGFFLTVTIIFEEMAYIINFSAPGLGVFITFLTIVVYRVMTEEKDKARIKGMFGKYVSPKVVDQILESPPELGGVDKDLTVFFSDIRGFTTLSESMTPQELVNHLNIYLTKMTDIILDFNGTLDKYVGDEIMCFWGAPVPQENHALLACKCALRQMEALHELNSGWPPEKHINIGIGVNSGIMTVGNMGSLGRMNYTLMGDNVNLGARLEGTNKQYLTHIIISENTYGLVKDKVVARELDNIRVKGKNKPVLIYELVDVIDEQ